jgi:hypothetical protein
MGCVVGKDCAIRGSMNTESPHERATAYLAKIAGQGAYLDNGFYRISAKRAGMLCKPYGVPRHGYERCIGHDGMLFWVARSVHQSKVVWTIRYSKLAIPGVAVAYTPFFLEDK